MIVIFFNDLTQQNDASHKLFDTVLTIESAANVTYNLPST